MDQENEKKPTKQSGNKYSGLLKNLGIWIVIFVVTVVLIKYINQPVQTAKTLTFSEFVQFVNKGSVKSVVIRGHKITGQTSDNKEFETYTPDDPNLIKGLLDKGVSITAKPEEQDSVWKSVLITWAPLLIILVIWWVLFTRQMQGGAGKALSFGKSRAKMLNEGLQNITFKDVAGVEEVKSELQEIIDFLKNPKKFTRLGGRIPKGVLLIGSPGTGKTLLARAIAGEAKVPFFSISGSDFVEMFVGVGAARVRDLFMQAKKSAPCIIFMDEIDAVGRYRGAGLGGGHDEREQTLNQLLVEMDGFTANEEVIMIAATNRPDILDPALLRPGRFDRRIVVSIPDLKGREEILKVHTKKIPLSEDVDLNVIARGIPGVTGADLANLTNEAALIAAKNAKDKVSMEDFEQAKDKILMGIERKSMVIGEKEKRLIAYHEAGHALVARSIPDSDPLHKVTIIPRGLALGITLQLPEEDKYTISKDHLLSTITVLMGGRAAEEIALGDISTGASNDLEKATDLARKMVCEWGMSEKLGPVTFGKKEELVFLGKEVGRQTEYSEATAVEIDKEIKDIIIACYTNAKDVIKNKLDLLNKFADKLLEKEILDASEIEALLNPQSANA
ncbi:MAG: ATP-dependent zinc metalloprotease FtsH [Deltaproteobacteria bacterium]|nr:ATP-dependent zinc metalloprotease FtsH [Deltaproteobacteria bacterium]MCL5792776.1 ATP-dependent zinc metalloprotease FtsH [Deltaproteobacteria bacterium]